MSETRTTSIPKVRSKEDWAKFWTKEFSGARKKIKKWHKDADRVNDRYLGKPYTGEQLEFCESQLNLFHSNVVTLQSMLFGNIPKVEVDRTFADANDDVARIAGEIATRMLNQDIQDAGEDYKTTLKSVLQDRLIPGYGSARVVYDYIEQSEEIPAKIDPESGAELAPAYTDTKVVEEWVDEVYTHWKDQLWSPCRTYSEMKWKAFRSYMDKDELIKRFGEDLAKTIPMSTNGTNSKDDVAKEENSDNDPQASVWEIWYKNTKKVYWFVEGMKQILEEKDDYLELDEFWPDPPPMIANITTSEFLPRPDYAIAQDLYREIDELQTRIAILTRACKAVGVYDKSCNEIQRMLQEGVENQLIPADNWAMFAEKGGLQGSVDWLPIEEVAKVIEILTNKQASKVQQLYEVTGMSDLLRGFSQKYESASTSKIKGQFASTRVQALQEDFARFASDLQAKKMQIIQKHFQKDCILYQSNIMQSMDGNDPQKIMEAIDLLKDRTKARWRVTIRAESLAMVDYQQMKEDRAEYLTALSTFMQSSAPLAELDPGITPFLLQLLQWGLAGFKGSNQIEGVLDKAIQQYQAKSKEPPKPDPEMVKAQAKMQELQAKMQMDREKHMAEMQQDQAKFQQDMRQAQQEFQLRMTEMQMEFRLKMTQMITEMQVKRQEQRDQYEFNTAERKEEAAANAADREHALAVKKEESKLPKGNQNA